MKKHFRCLDVSFAGNNYTQRLEEFMNDLYAEGFTFVATLGSVVIMEDNYVCEGEMKREREERNAKLQAELDARMGRMGRKSDDWEILEPTEREGR